MEKTIYEIRPYVFGLLAVAMFFTKYNSTLLNVSCALLLGMSALIVHTRWKHRSFIRRLNL